jgi:UDP-N-acetylmuramoylalanine--D-glutamate ligase
MRYVIVGLGKTGLSCARYLAAQGQTFAITDSRADPPGLKEFKACYPDAPLAVGGFSLPLMQTAQELVVSQGVSFQEPTIIACREQGIPIIGDIELFARHVKKPVIAITGSNAKSTVTTLVGDMAKGAGLNVKVGGNLGTPALDLLEGSAPDLYVLEISNFQLETTYSLHATVATVLNISPDHLDRYAQFEDYVAAKQRIYKGCQCAVVNRDDALTQVSSTTMAESKPQIVSFGTDTPTVGQFGLRQIQGKTYLAIGDENLLAVDSLKIKGKHNWTNALAALAIGYQAGLPLAPMLDVLKQFTGLPHRCEWVRQHNDVDWYNDSKGTNIGATIAAINGLGSTVKGKLILLAGGLGKGADFTELRPVVEQYVRTLIVFGQDAPLITQALSQSVTIIQATTFAEAVQLAANHALPHDAVLLSPACASWDMFNNFEHRGQVFCQLVKELTD